MTIEFIPPKNEEEAISRREAFLDHMSGFFYEMQMQMLESEIFGMKEIKVEKKEEPKKDDRK